jgi:hypothetical protein
MQAGSPSRFRAIALWAVAYVATMTAVLWGLQYGRDMVVAQLGDPESVAAWREWAEETRRPTDADQPVERRPVKSDEPPALILMRDHFGSVRAVALVIGTFVFAFLGFLAHGIWSQRGATPDGSRHSTHD